MNRFFLLIFSLTFFLFTACDGSLNPTDDGLPDEFWGLTTWRFERGPGLSYNGEHTARIELHFVETGSNDYSVEGTIEYNDEITCSWTPGVSLCPDYFCEVPETKDGTLVGTATETAGILTVDLSYTGEDDRPRETVAIECKNEPSIASTTPWEILAQTLQAEGGMVYQTWTLDVADITFIDDIPTDSIESSGAKTASLEFSTTVEYSLDTGEGLFALYRNKPE